MALQLGDLRVEAVTSREGLFDRATQWDQLLEWHLVRAEGRLLAAQLACRVGQQVYLWKIAFDEQYSACSPGRLLIMRTLERAFADPAVDEVNCLTVTPWNRDWNMSLRSYHDVLAWPRRLRPLVTAYLPHRTRQLLRDMPGARTAYSRVLDLKRRFLGDRGVNRPPPPRVVRARPCEPEPDRSRVNNRGPGAPSTHLTYVDMAGRHAGSAACFREPTET